MSQKYMIEILTLVAIYTQRGSETSNFHVSDPDYIGW